MAGICGRRWFMRSMKISLRYMARSGAFPVAAVGGLVPALLDRHNRLAARIQHGRYTKPNRIALTARMHYIASPWPTDPVDNHVENPPSGKQCAAYTRPVALIA